MDRPELRSCAGVGNGEAIGFDQELAKRLDDARWPPPQSLQADLARTSLARRRPSTANGSSTDNRSLSSWLCSLGKLMTESLAMASTDSYSFVPESSRLIDGSMPILLSSSRRLSLDRPQGLHHFSLKGVG